MLGEFATRVLVLVLGYAYPAFECFKTVEKNRVEIEELRYWCQYWILVAVVTVAERIFDVFVSWVPMYWEMKLALFIYLWYPKTKGSGYVYDTLLKPYIIKHETDIDRNLAEFRARAWDLLVYYWQNCTQLGQSTFLQLLDFLFTNVIKLRQPIQQRTTEVKEPPPAPPSPPPPVPPSPSNTPSSATTGGGGLFRRNNRQSYDRRKPPLPPQSPFSARQSVATPTASESVQVHLHHETQFVRTEEDPSEIEMDLETDSDSSRSPPKSARSSQHKQQHNVNQQHLNLTRLKLKRSKGFH